MEIISIAISTLCAFCMMSCTAPTSESATVSMSSGEPASNDARDALPEVSVQILGPVKGLTGHAWPRGYDLVYNKEDVPLGLAAMEQPHELILHLPSGRMLRHVSKGTIFGQHKQTVEDANLLPHPGELEFQEAIKLLELILGQWDGTPDGRSAPALNEWKGKGNLQPYELAEFRGRAVLRGEDKVDVTYQIRPGQSGWRLWLLVGATMQERGRLHGTLIVDGPASNPLRE